MLIAALVPPAASPAVRWSPRTGYRFQAVSTCTIAPDGASVAYLVTRYDKEADESRSALWTRRLGARRGPDPADPRRERLGTGASVPTGAT